MTDWITQQWGESLVGAWTDKPTSSSGESELLIGIFDAGMVFDASVHQDISLIDSITDLTLVLTCQRYDFGATDTVVELGLVPSPAPAAYSGSAVPWSRSEVGLGSYTLDLSAYPAETRESVVLSGAALVSLRTHVTDSPAWNGRVAISLRAVGAHPFILRNYAGNLVTAETTLTLLEAEEEAAIAAGSRRFRPRVVNSTKLEERRVSFTKGQASIPTHQGIYGSVDSTRRFRR